MSTPGASEGRRHSGERGSALVEFALIASVLFVLLFGIIEFGLAFRDKLTASNAAQGAARVGAAMGQDPAADWLILESARQALGGAADESIVKYIRIYLADANGEPDGLAYNDYAYVPDGDPVTCDWAPCPDPADFSGYGGTWVPGGRDTTVEGGLDVLGVRIYYSHDWLTGGLLPLTDALCTSAGNANCWVDTSLVRLEPKS